jgi:Beta/Gamma crystallin
MTTVTMYQDAGFTGNYMVLNYSDADLSTHWVQPFNPFWTWDNSVSSLKVEGGDATFYVDKGYGGYSVTLHPGQYARVDYYGIPNDSISSVSIPTGSTTPPPPPPHGPGGTPWTP